MRHPLVGTSIGRKAVMALTGLVLFGFVVAHMLGNLQIFLGQDALNEYAHFLQGATELLWVARAVLIASLVAHVAAAVSLSRQNAAARPVAYGVQSTVQASYASRTMMMSGVIVSAFIVYHLMHFTFKTAHPEYSHLLDPDGRHDVYSMVVLSYQNFYITAAYVLAMVPLTFHMSHGFQSLFQSLGFNHPQYTPFLKKASIAIALVVLVGNTAIPVACFTGVVKAPGAAALPAAPEGKGR